ncbi:unnamed protein product [Urochloa humidicola]
MASDSGGADRRPHQQPPRPPPAHHPPSPPRHRRRRAHQRPLPPLAPRLGHPPGALPPLPLRPRARLLGDGTAPPAHGRRAGRARRAGRDAPRLALPRWVPAALGDDPLLRFLASRRVAGEIRLTLRDGCDDVVLPPCETATAISLCFVEPTLRFQPPPLPGGAGAGSFAALASLRIKRARVDGRELGEVLFSRCPRLKELFLKRITLKDRHDVLSVRSDSLERLDMEMTVGFDARVEVFAPRLKVLAYKRIYGGDARIAAPGLLELCWYGLYDPTRHDLREAGRHLQRLEIAKNSPAAQLIQQFYSIHELQLTLKVWEGIYHYNHYLQLINGLCKCKVLVVGFVVTQHAIKPVILQFLNKCAGVKKIVVRSLGYRMDKCLCKSWECQCDGSKKQSPKIDDTALGSLELVEIKDDMEAYHKVEFVKLLCEYSASFQKRVTITVIENKQSVREKIFNICVPNDKVVINVNVRSTQET